jgi:GNAT superfamily N-acetyltransferase
VLGEETNVTIRELRVDDLGAVLSLRKAFFAEYEAHHDDFFDTDDLRDEHLSGRFLKSITSDSSGTIVALVDSSIVGYASIGVHSQSDFYKAKRVGGISGLMVEPAFRRQGIAAKLLAEAKRWFRQKGASISRSTPPSQMRLRLRSIAKAACSRFIPA